MAAAKKSALLDAIYASPDDDDARLVYADSLLEKNDPRGELIQLQCEIAKVDEDDPRLGRMKHRERALLKAHGDAWLKDARAIHKHLEFELVRGFPGSVRGPAKTLAEHAKKIGTVAPLALSVEAVAYDRDLGSFFASPLFARAKSVRIMGRRIELAPLGAMKKPLPLPLTRLELEASLDRADFEALVQSRALASLRDLDLSRCLYNKDAPAPLEALAPPLERFSVLSGKYPEHFARALVHAPAFERLTALGLCNTPIGDAGLATFIAAGRLHALEIDLRSAGLSVKGVNHLLDALPEKGLRRLQLGGNKLDDAVAARIAKWAGAAAIEKLDLGTDAIGDKGVLALAAAPNLGSLRSLVMTGCKAGAKAQAKLIAAFPNTRLYVGSRFLKH